MLAEECEGAVPGEVSGPGVVDGGAVVVEEGVAGARVGVELVGLAVGGQRFAEGADAVGVGVGVAFGEMSEDRSVELGEVGFDVRVDAVEVHAGPDAGIKRCGEQAELATHAEADDADFAGDAGLIQEGGDGAFDNVGGVFDVESHHERAGFVGFVGLLAVVEIGGEGGKTGGGEAIGDAGDVADETPPFLDNDDAVAGGFSGGEIALVGPVLVRKGEELSHG